MRRIIASLAATLLFSFSASAEVTLLQAGRVITDARKPAIGPGVVAVRDGRIIGVGAAGAAPASLGVQPGEKVTTIDLGARTLLPGLIDAHTHIAGDPGGKFWEDVTLNPRLDMMVGAKNARLTLEAGFTTVRDLGAAPDSAQALRDGIARGLIPGPRMLVTGPAISIIGGHADASNGFNSLIAQSLRAQGGKTCTGPEECAKRVREASAEGVDWIKITATGGVLSQQARGLGLHFSQAEMDAIVATATSLGLKVAAHAHGADGVLGAVRAGVTSIDHGTFIDDAGAKLMKEKGAYLVPTLMPAKQYMEAKPGTYTPVVQAKIDERLAALGKNIALAKRVGVPIAFGTDSGVYPHGRNGEEFAMMVQYGKMTPQEALASSLVTAAEMMGIQNEAGVLAAGRAADVIAVEGDPLTDAASLTRVSFVMARGKVIKAP